MNRVDRAIAAGTQFLISQQRQDGGFDGMASADKLHFTNSHIRPTIFFTALICQACHEVTDTKVLQKTGCDFLLRHKSSAWSWNYWQRNIKNQAFAHYPDDLDDTACAISAILQHDPSQLTGTVLGNIGKQLVASEAAVGGPYQTWLVAPQLLTTWHDIDVAVNANIAGMLDQARVMPPGLETFLEQAIVANKLHSSYYISDIPTLYFMARSGQHAYTKKLTERVISELQQPARRSPLQNSLLLAAACRLNYSATALRPLVERLLRSQQGGSWPANALYVEPVIEGVAYYAGSEALTTAFACEALSLYQKLQQQPNAPAAKVSAKNSSRGLQLVRRHGRSLSQPLIRHHYLRAIRIIGRRDHDNQICAQATQFAADAAIALPKTTTDQLDAASIAGWIAYTAYDDILDGDTDASQLGMANLALRQCLAHFGQALGDLPSFNDLVADVLNTIDEANTWEFIHAHRPVGDGKLHLRHLPDYSNLSQLAERSWGHVLATSGVLLATGYPLSSQEMQHWHSYFRNFLIARQLNDDAHDWLEDLAAGRLTAVVTLLLTECGITELDHTIHGSSPIRQHFWETTIVAVCDYIDTHILLANAALDACTFLADDSRYRERLNKLAAATQASRAGRRQALEFISSFGAVS